MWEEEEPLTDEQTREDDRVVALNITGNSGILSHCELCDNYRSSPKTLACEPRHRMTRQTTAVKS